MKTKNKRAIRRYRREKAIQHAFNVYWYSWGQNNDTYKFNRWQDEEIYLETNEERFKYQDEHRQDVLNTVKLVANHLRNCSCFLCSGYKDYEKTRKQLQTLAKDRDDETALFDDDSWEDAAFNPDISASPVYSHRI